ncbi:MAG: pyruvate carboxylase [Deltaproteobacteria bacterium]|nr:pyruvate carboxylase [Deltaproteobacteria bacterium]
MKQKDFLQVKEELKGKPILVANRGIPARRICRSIKELGAIPIIAATDLDKTAPFTSGAKELLLLGRDPRAYLDVDLMIRLAKRRGVAGIHPGWGFASESEDFPHKCRDAGITFIGPDQRSMQQLGNKVSVRKLARSLGIPVIAGSRGAVDLEEAEEIAREIGFPLMLKAEGGGGGRGIHIVKDNSELRESFRKASSLAQAEFGNPRLYMEKYLESVRHIEIQVLADRYGNCIAFDERDCTVQRKHQKLVEITPSPWSNMSPELREKLKEYARRLVEAVGYHSLCTVEFLLDQDANPYLIEVNTRLQVEHGITECRYGIDLVEEQIAVAFGAKLRWTQSSLRPHNHAMQVRINCEDPKNDFAPNGGLIHRYLSPGGQGIRVDSCLSAGYNFPTQYDSAGALLIAYGNSWEKVLSIMDRALEEYIIYGVKTTVGFHKRILKHSQFRAGEFDTSFVENHPELLLYHDKEDLPNRVSKLIAEISARGYNPFIELGEYRTRGSRRIGRFDPVLPSFDPADTESPYKRGDRDAILDYVRDSSLVHFTDTTPRDITQSNTGNRLRLAEDKLIGPYLDNCKFFSIENGGGAHFHVAMLANMTYPFEEAAQWNRFAPKTLKQILIRSTNILGYKPQPRNVMRVTGEMICQHYDVIRCFDFLNHIENMEPFAEVVMASRSNIFEPALSLSYGNGFDIPHYLSAVDEIITMISRVTGLGPEKASKRIILGLKDMAGVCPPTFISSLVKEIRKKYPELVLHYHRHFTDGLFVPAVAAAAKAGAHIVDTAIGAAVRWYGQGDVLSTAAYIEELGMEVCLNKEMIRKCNFVLKQIMPYYDAYTSPYFQGVDYDVVEHGMPGGATSSSQEGAMKQGYIHLLPYMLEFLSGTRKIVKYHDVTPGSQITWNTAFLAVTGAYKRGGEKEVRTLLQVLKTVVETPEEELPEEIKAKRLDIYRDCNDAFRNLLLGRFGRLPLGFPPQWVYESAFGKNWKQAMEQRTEDSPLKHLLDVDLDEERKNLFKEMDRIFSEEEFVMYLNHPSDAIKTMRFQEKFGDPNLVPLDVWFEGLEIGEEVYFNDKDQKPHRMVLLDISEPDARGIRTVRYTLDSETMTHEVEVGEARQFDDKGEEMADPGNKYHIGAPSTGDLWAVLVEVGDVVKKGEELCNLSIMKQEKAVYSPVDGVVKRILKYANYQEDKKMVPVKEGELLMELAPLSSTCDNCKHAIVVEGGNYCPYCGTRLMERARAVTA